MTNRNALTIQIIVTKTKKKQRGLLIFLIEIFRVIQYRKKRGYTAFFKILSIKIPYLAKDTSANLSSSYIQTEINSLHFSYQSGHNQITERDSMSRTFR